MRYFLEIAYKGTNYFGWQRQPNELSVQQVVEDCLSTFLRQEIAIVGAGRTDSGVHAKQMFAHFDVEPIEDVGNFIFRMNSFLPKDIVIKNIYEVGAEAHARFDALERTYEYKVVIGKDPFMQDTAFQVNQKPNIEMMNQAAKMLLNHSDFQCFSKSKTDVKTYICSVKEAFWKKDGNKLIFTIKADRFLRNMVRAIVGTLLDIGHGKKTIEDLERILNSKNRSMAGASVPGHGLYLVRVQYPKELFLGDIPTSLQEHQKE